jgi:hypothetical protein
MAAVRPLGVGEARQTVKTCRQIENSKLKIQNI